MQDFIPHRFILLTGAGFSYPFGGLLASEFRDALFNRKQVQRRAKLRMLLLDEPSFENALAIVRSSAEFDAEDVEALESAVMEVFIAMDADEARHAWRDGAVSLQDFQTFLSSFEAPTWGYRDKNAGFIFTLNQDLLPERHWYNFRHFDVKPVLPGVPVMQSEGTQWFGTNLHEYSPSYEVVVPTDVELEVAGRTNYVKLHGSMNWRASDGERTLVVGTGKTEQIDRVPLLAAYFDLFKTVLMSGDRKLMVVGYSFQDTHINEVIDRAVREAGLTIYIWDPFTNRILQTIRERPECSNIIMGLNGMYPRRMHEVFPYNRDTGESSIWREMKEKFFEI